MPIVSAGSFRPRRRFRRRFLRRRTNALVPFRRSRRSINRYSVPRAVKSYRGEYSIVKMRYALNLGLSHSITSTGGAMGTDYIYRANGCYDPYYLTGGHQPRGFDQYMEMFRNFAVLGSKLVVNFGYGQGSSTSHDMRVAIVLRDGNSTMTNIAVVEESPRRKSFLMTAHRDKATLVSTYSYKINGCQDIMDNQNLWGTSASDPSNEEWYWHIVGWQPEGNDEGVRFTGFIDYTVIFFHAIIPPQS